MLFEFAAGIDLAAVMHRWRQDCGPAVAANVAESAAHLAAFNHRYGFDRRDSPPPALPAGQSIATRNAFLLKAEMGKGEGEEH